MSLVTSCKHSVSAAQQAGRASFGTCFNNGLAKVGCINTLVLLDAELDMVIGSGVGTDCPEWTPWVGAERRFLVDMRPAEWFLVGEPELQDWILWIGWEEEGRLCTICNGSLLEPGHRDDLGSCWWTVPLWICSWCNWKQWLQIPCPLLTAWDNGHRWPDCI